jgi:hypothetical protein
MGKINSRAKGAAGERELAGYLREQGWQKARRTQQYAGNPEGGSGDVVCENFPFHIEGKRCQQLKPEVWMQQAMRDCPNGKIPAVFFRRNGEKKWLVILTADDICELARTIAPPRMEIEHANALTHTAVGAGFWVQKPDELHPTYIQPIQNPNK